MDFEKFVDYFSKISLDNLSISFILLSCGLSTVLLVLIALIEFAKSKVFQYIKLFVNFILVVLIDFVFISCFQGRLMFFPYLLSPFLAVVSFNKFFGDVEEFKVKKKEKEKEEEKEKTPEEVEAEQLEKIKDAFNKCINPSIIEILFIYGYISENHKNTLEMNNIFDSPDEMAEKLLTTYVLTPEQLKEARAIMNIIRTSNKIVSKQEALKILANRKGDDNNASNN